MSYSGMFRIDRKVVFSLTLAVVSAGQFAFAAQGLKGVVSDAQTTVVTSTANNAPALVSPRGIVIDASSGDIVIADSGYKALFAYDTSGNYVGTVDVSKYGLNLPTGITTDATGGAYMSDQANNKVIYITPKAPFPGTAITTSPAYQQVTAIAVNRAANDLYIADGTLGAVFLVPGQGSTSTANEFVAKGKGKSVSPQGIAISPSGKIYVADVVSNDIYLLNPATGNGNQFSALGVGYPGAFAADRAANQPTAMSFDAAGNLYVLDTTARQILEIPVDAAGTGLNAAGASVLPFSSPLFVTQHTNTGNNFPAGLASDSNGNLFLSDSHTPQLSRVNASNSPINFGAAQFGTPITPGVVFNYAFTQVGTLTPSSVTAVLNGLTDQNDFVKASGSNCNQPYITVSAFAPATCQVIVQANYGNITPWNTRATGVRNGAFQLFVTGSTGPVSSIPVIGTALAPSLVYWPAAYLNNWYTGLNAPQSIAADFAGYYVYEADSGSGNLYKLRIGQSKVTLNYLPSGFLLNGRKTSPTAVAVDGAGNVYVGDQNLKAVFVIPVNGSGPYQLNTGTITLNLPLSITLDQQNNIYIGDSGTAGINASSTTPGFIVKVPASGAVATKLSVSAGGQSIIFPESLVTDAAGNLYIGDGGDANGAGIKVAVLPTTSTTIAQMITTNVLSPAGLGFDPANNLYILDSYNRRIVEVPITYSGGAPTAGTQFNLPGMDTILSKGFFTPTSMSVTYGGRYIFVSDITGSSTGYIGVIDHEINGTGPNSSFDFGTVAVNSSVTQAITQQNVGNQLLTSNDNFKETGDPTPWTFTSPTCNPNLLNAGAICAFNLTFAPTTAGTFYLNILPATNSLDPTNPDSFTYSMPLNFNGVGK